MKVLFLYPNEFGQNLLPTAIGIFTAILKKNGHEVDLFDTSAYENAFKIINSDKEKSENLNARPYDDSIIKNSVIKSDPYQDFIDKVESFSPDLIAVTATEDIYPNAIIMLSVLGNDRPRVVLGGVFATFAPELAFTNSKGTIDYILRGEGESSLLEMCSRIQNNEDIVDIPGLYMINDNKVIKNKLPKPVDLNTLPIPDYSLFRDSSFYKPMQGKLRKILPIQTIRGCPYKCAYCNSPSQITLHKNDGQNGFFRKLTIDLVREEIESAINDYGANTFYFWADTFLSWRKEEFDEFCDMYKDYKIPFWIQTRPETINEYNIGRLKEIGLLRIGFGLEHGNEDFRAKYLFRKIKNADIIKSLNLVYEHDIPFSVNNIMGFPNETRELTFDTINLNRQIKSDGINAYTFVPFSGTPLRKIAEDAGFITSDQVVSCNTSLSVLNMPNYPRELIEGVRRCFVLYVKMPRDRWNEIKLAEQLTPEGDAIFAKLKEECFLNYMNYGDYEED